MSKIRPNSISLSCFCGRQGVIPMLGLAETRNIRCGTCASPIQIWRADNPGGPSQIRYRSDRTFVQSAYAGWRAVPFERLTSEDSTKLRNGGSATGVLSPRIIRDLDKLREIVLAGQVELTLVYVPKGQTQSVRVTYRIGYMTANYAARRGIARTFQVKVVDSNRLTRQSPVLGTIGSDGVFVKVNKPDPAMAKHMAVFEHFYRGSGTTTAPGNWTEIPSSLEIWRGERCVRCYHRLTDPDSIHSGWGAHCASVAGVIRLKAPLAAPALGEGASVYRDIMLDCGQTDPSAPIVLRTALERLDRGGDEGAIARMAVDHAMSVLGMDEAQLREACALDALETDGDESEEEDETDE